MNILAIAEDVPMPDRAAMFARFYHILKTLAGNATVYFHYDRLGQIKYYDEAVVDGYCRNLEELGIEVGDGTGNFLSKVLRKKSIDVVLFEQFHIASTYMEEVRFWQPGARVVTDSVDIAFQKLLSKAQTTRKKADYAEAERAKKLETGVYRNSELVIVVSKEDQEILKDEGILTPVEIVPTVHDIEALPQRNPTCFKTLTFVGNYLWDANVDAVRYFCKEIFPLLLREIPDARLQIVGNSPTPEVIALEAENVAVLGYVPDLKPIYEGSSVSIAPLRYGGGIKGKITEAMCMGLPVVTTSVGRQGFDVVDGKHLMVGDTPEEFAGHIVRLLSDRSLYEQIRANAWQFAMDNYSSASVSERISSMCDRVRTYPVKKLSPLNRLNKSMHLSLNRYLLWRIRRPRRLGSPADDHTV